MLLGGIVSPSPSPTRADPSPSNDPFNPDVTIFPPAPAWLFPSVMIALAIAAVVVVVLVVLWRKSVVEIKREKAARGPVEWVDLSKLDKKGNWDDAGPALDDGDAGSPDTPKPPR